MNANSIWITAWVISALVAAGVWFCAWRSGLEWLRALVCAVIFFPAPLFVAMAGNNSFIYAFDLVIPLAVWLAVRRWPRVPPRARRAALWLLVGVGLAPLAVLGLLADRMNLLYAGISFYRLIGAMAMLCVMSDLASQAQKEGGWLIAAFSWMNVVLVLATVLQSRGWINSNVFYTMSDDAALEENESMRFITAGLFRGSLGIIGTLGWMAFLAQYEARGVRAGLALAGGVAGVLVVLLCGSKTSLLAVLLITVAVGILFPRVLRRIWGRVTVVSAMLAVVTGALLLRMDSDYFSYTLGVLGFSDESFGTLTYRQSRWSEALEFVDERPLVWLGADTPFGKEDRGLSYFHNEYITILMGGGIWSEAGYLIGLVIIGRAVLGRRREAGSQQLFAALTLLTGVIQGLTVNHLLPGIFFSCTTTIMACGYGLGLGEARRTREQEQGQEQETEALSAALEEPDPNREPSHEAQPEGACS